MPARGCILETPGSVDYSDGRLAGTCGRLRQAQLLPSVTILCTHIVEFTSFP